MTALRKELFDLVRPWLDTRGWTPDRIAATDAFCDRAGLPANENPAPAAPPQPTGLGDPQAFFDFLRADKLLGPVLTASEVSGCNAIVAACGAQGWPIADTAYALATAYHETSGTMQPIHEYGGDAYFRRMYDIEGARPEKARELGNLFAGDGIRYAGRGYVQLTGRKNYAKAAAALGVPLEESPDLALQPDIAAAIMVRGMREGWFTARDLDDDLPRQGKATLAQFVASRDIINGRDKADKIAGEAITFQDALARGGWA
jgi:hypothetical protein